MRNITRILSEINNSGIPTTVILCVETEQKLLKKDNEGNKNELGPIYKRATVVVELNASYQDAVNNQRAAEYKPSNFVAEQRKWGEADGTMVVNKDEMYLNTLLKETVGTPTYFNIHGIQIDEGEFKRFRSTAKRPSNQGLDNPIQVRTYKLSSIVSVLTSDGKLFTK